MGDPEEEGRAPERRVLDLSVVQVVASTLAAVGGALMASLLGVHGTIVGAAVVSTSATTGAAVFQHLFRRTGEGIRGRMAVGGAPRTPGEERAGHRADAQEAFGPPTDATVTGEHSGTMAVPDQRDGVGRKPRGWKTYTLTTGLVFVLAMGVVTTVELIAGKPVAAVVKNEPGSGTSIGGGSTGTPSPSTSGTPTPAASTDLPPRTDASASPDAGASPDASATPDRTPSPSPSSGPSAPPSPAPSSGSAT